MKSDSEDKAKRVLEIYSRLMQGKTIDKKEESKRYGVSERTIQRDLTDIQSFLQNVNTDNGVQQEIVYDKQNGGYGLEVKLKSRTSLSAQNKINVNERIKAVVDIIQILD